MHLLTLSLLAVVSLVASDWCDENYCGPGVWLYPPLGRKKRDVNGSTQQYLVTGLVGIENGDVLCVKFQPPKSPIPDVCFYLPCPYQHLSKHRSILLVPKTCKSGVVCSGSLQYNNATRWYEGLYSESFNTSDGNSQPEKSIYTQMKFAFGEELVSHAKTLKAFFDWQTV